MYTKRFYRGNGSDRKRKCRERQVMADIIAELNSSHASNVEDCADNRNNLSFSLVNEHVFTENKIMCDHITDPPSLNIEATNDDGNNNDDSIIEDKNDDGDYSDCDDVDDDDENFNDLFHSSNKNRKTNLHSSTSLSVYDGCVEIIKISQELNLNKYQINRLLNSIRLLLPVDNKLPRTISSLFKIVGKYFRRKIISLVSIFAIALLFLFQDIDTSKKVSYYCRECLHPLLSPKQTHCTVDCSMNGQRRAFRNVSEMVICDVKKEVSTTVQRHMHLILEYPKKSKQLLPCDIPNSDVSYWFFWRMEKTRPVLRCYLVKTSAFLYVTFRPSILFE